MVGIMYFKLNLKSNVVFTFLDLKKAFDSVYEQNTSVLFLKTQIFSIGDIVLNDGLLWY